MKKSKHSSEQIISILRQAEVDLAGGSTIEAFCRKHSISEQTFYRWRNQYGGMKANDMKRLRDLEVENQRLKKIVADLSIDNSILREVSKIKF
jgi:transposase-like protein